MDSGVLVLHVQCHVDELRRSLPHEQRKQDILITAGNKTWCRLNYAHIWYQSFYIINLQISKLKAMTYLAWEIDGSRNSTTTLYDHQSMHENFYTSISRLNKTLHFKACYLRVLAYNITINLIYPESQQQVVVTPHLIVSSGHLRSCVWTSIYLSVRQVSKQLLLIASQNSHEASLLDRMIPVFNHASSCSRFWCSTS